MRLLLDSHVFLWAFSDPGRLSPNAKAAIGEPRNQRWLSHASLWELTIKIAAGRLRLGGPLADLVAGSRVALLPVELGHIEATGRLPFHHGDPFDRMLVAQAIEEGLTLVTADKALRRYPVACLW
jgi:PIN domain nuclease of toxin-antitoxin system